MSLEKELEQYDFKETDLTFFTNEPERTLLDRFLRTLKDTQYFDIIVGYFRYSGFHRLYKSLETIDKVRIVVGLSVDKKTFDIVDNTQRTLDFNTHKKTRETFSKELVDELEESNESDANIEEGVLKFLEYLKTDCANPEEDIENGGNGKKLEIRAFKGKNLHAKVYISRYQQEDRDYGNVVTGSSNFSESGLIANREFNVQLKNKADVLFALKQFQSLWKDSIELSEEFIDTINKKTWLNNAITPYELYLKFLYEYFQEEINLDERFQPHLPPGFMELEYQLQAVTQAKKILDTYNGVFLADVVGLGKTFIAALLLQQLKGNILVICPPVLQEYWKESLYDFKVVADVESSGKLERILARKQKKYDYIVIDEAHRFRNEGTQSYANILEICRNKKVILVTATPLNNRIHDIFAQLKLFQIPRRSLIPGIPNLEKYFNDLQKELNKWDKSTNDFQVALKSVSEEIREKILKYVMVRRTRTDVMNHFQEDMVTQGLTFPDIANPIPLTYTYKGEMETTFLETMKLLKNFKYARYVALTYYTGTSRQLTEFEKQQQRNVGGFMKAILVKRLESSIYAFKKSIGRFINSHEQFIEMFEEGTIYISKKINVYDFLYSEEIEELERLVENEEVSKYNADDFKDTYIEHLRDDLEVLKKISRLWAKAKEDPKLDSFLYALKSDKQLKKQKLVIFTESKETGDYLYENVLKEFPKKVLFFSSKGGRHTNKTLTSNRRLSRDLILDNFDPKAKQPKNNIRILITTDILAEGINLHNSNVLVNYDLPWNPTRVLQRAGRVNRLGSNYDQVFIFNFFPTTQADLHLGLRDNVIAKINLFHNILGEDAKYLSDGEEFSSQELFDTLNGKAIYLGEEEGDSELNYIEVIRKIRDDKPGLFEKIKFLPKKARSGHHKEETSQNQLVTFFRSGYLKKFYLNQNGKSKEITFFDAARLLECLSDTKKAKIPKNYYLLLDTNKERFSLDTNQVLAEADKGKSGRSNVKYILKRLKSKEFKQEKRFTELDEEYIYQVRKMLELGMVAKKVAQKVKKAIEVELSPLNTLTIVRTHIEAHEVETEQNNMNLFKKDIILSSYINPE